MSTPVSSTSTLIRKPLDDEIDVYGLTHQGLVRESNQDHFLISSLRKRMDVHMTSLPADRVMPAGTERLAFLAMVADGVGGLVGGEEASRLTVEAVTDYIVRSMHCYYTADATDDAAFASALADAAMECHTRLAEETEAVPENHGMATTLTLFLGVWPRSYVLQVGDSRYYLLRGEQLTQISRDQTVAQELIDQGLIAPAEASRSRWAHVLSSAIGGPRTTPVVNAVAQDWGYVNLLCSDGLTKHVSDERIRERLLTMTSARQVCEDLLRDALDGGGTDNITILVGRTLRGREG